MGIHPIPRPEVGAISGNLVVEIVGDTTVWCYCVCERGNHRRVSHEPADCDDWRSEKITGCLVCCPVVGTKPSRMGWRRPEDRRKQDG